MSLFRTNMLQMLQMTRISTLPLYIEKSLINQPSTLLCKVSKMFRMFNLSKVKTSLKKLKTKKCQSTARAAPDLIQTECSPDSGLARPNIKINGTKKSKSKIKTNSTNVTLVKKDGQTKLFSQQVVKLLKTKKCQSSARTTPDLIQTVCSPGSGLARPQKKINRTKKIKLKIKSNSSNVTLAKKNGPTKWFYQHLVNLLKTKKCQSSARATPDLIQTVCSPGSGLARPQKK